MKKAFYILLIMSSMGFTSGSATSSKPQAEKKKRIEHSSVQSGYLEVSSPASYSLTTGN